MKCVQCGKEMTEVETLKHIGTIGFCIQAECPNFLYCKWG